MNRRHFLVGLAGFSGLMLAACGAPRAEPAVDEAAGAVEGVTEGEPAAPLLPEARAAALPERLEIPRLELDIPVVELGWHPATDREGQIFSEWDVAEYAAGWHKNSALPGEGGNVVMSGHNNILGAVFRELDQLKQGDEITVFVGETGYVYGVTQVVVVPETYVDEEQRIANAAWIGTFDEERLTLVSCWPRDNNTHRIVVVAHPTDTTVQRSS